MFGILMTFLLVAMGVGTVIVRFPGLFMRIGAGVFATVVLSVAAYVFVNFNWNRQNGMLEVAFVAPPAECDSGLAISIDNRSNRELSYVESDFLGFEPGFSRPKIQSPAYNDLNFATDLIVPAKSQATVCLDKVPWTLVKDSSMSERVYADPLAFQWELRDMRACLSFTPLESLLGLAAPCDAP